MYLVDLVGLEKFNNATGIVNLFRGFGCFIGPYAAGNSNFIIIFISILIKAPLF